MKIKNSQKLTVILSTCVTSIAMADDIDTNLPYAYLDKIVVTANKMDESILDVPSSISVISNIDIEDKGIQDISDVIKQIPNLSDINYGFQRSVNFRGINPSQLSSTNPVVIYVDGVPQSSIFDYEVMLEDAERVEVLRGSQSTLYGKDSIGGVINVISKEPKNEWYGRVGAEYGSNNYMQGTVNANGALIDDKLFLNIGVLADKNDGWITNDYNGSDGNTFKESRLNSILTFKPNDQMTTKLSLGANNTKTTYYNAGFGKFGEITREDAKHANYEVPSPTQNKSFSQALNVDYDFSDLTFSSSTAHRKIEVDSVFDGDLTYDPENANLMNGLEQFQKNDIDTLSQELRLSSDKNEKLNWVAGLYFEKEDIKYHRLGYQFPYIDKSSGKYFGSFESDVPSKTNAKTKAIFSQVDYDISDVLSLTLGGRYQVIDKDIELVTNIFPVTGGKEASVLDLPQKDSDSWYSFIPKLALNYNINDDTSVFASYSKGYLPGGFNYFPNPPGGNLKYEPQTSDNYEVGMRGSFLNKDLNLGANIFYMDINDIQLYNFGIDSNNVYFSTASNDGQAKSKGIELDGSYRLNDDWTINAALGFTDANYTKHTNEAYNGNRIRATPNYTANVGMGYFNPEGFYGRLDVNAQGSIYFDDANTQKQKSWITPDVRVGYLNNDINVYGYVKNITNESHVENVLNNLIYFNEPRTYGIGVKYSF